MLFQPNLKQNKVFPNVTGGVKTHCIDFFLPFANFNKNNIKQQSFSLVFLKRTEFYFIFYIITPRGNFKFYCKRFDGLFITKFVDLNFFVFSYNKNNNVKDRYFNHFATFCKVVDNLLFMKYHFADFTIKGETYEAYLIDSKTISVQIGFTHNLSFSVPNTMYMKNLSNDLQLLFRLYGPSKLLVLQTIYKIKLLKKRDKYKGLGIFFADEIVQLRLSKKVLKKNKP